MWTQLLKRPACQPQLLLCNSSCRKKGLPCSARSGDPAPCASQLRPRRTALLWVFPGGLACRQGYVQQS